MLSRAILSVALLFASLPSMFAQFYPTITGESGFWYLGKDSSGNIIDSDGSGCPLGYCYYAQVLWTANANGASGSPTWHVSYNESGGNVVLDCYTSCASPVTATAQTPSAGCVYDITVYVTYPDSSQSANFDVAVIQPNALTYSSVSDSADGSDGWQSNTTWHLYDACGGSLPYMDFNEAFGAVSTDYSGQNWSAPTESYNNSGSAYQVIDMMLATGVNLSPQAENPQSPTLSSTAVYHNPWLFNVGSATLCTTTCSGIFLYSDTQQRYLDHGRHQ